MRETVDHEDSLYRKQMQHGSQSVVYVVSETCYV